MGRTEQLLDPAVCGSAAEELKGRLRARMVGQDEAIDSIVSVYQAFVAGLASPGRPVGNFLFLGPTGTGKTRVVEALAESLVGNPRAIVKIDCAEFQHSHEIAKLIGSPPGYLGHRETHPALSQEAIDRHHTAALKLSFVLFDEIEKASDALWNLLLGILDKGTLTLGDNKPVDFSRAMIFMTSNLGAREMMTALRPGLGFASAPEAKRVGSLVERAGVDAARRKFTPEFMNRLDKVVVFHPLGAEEMHRILDIELAGLRRRFQEAGATARIDFTLSRAARRHLLEQGTDARYGARHLKRVLERSLVYPMSSLLASGQVYAGDVVRVDLDPDREQLLFYRGSDAAEVADAEPVAEPPELAAVAAGTAATVRAVKVSAARRK